jgi:hypothetical protein
VPVTGVSADVDVEIVRTETRRLRIGKVDVTLATSSAAPVHPACAGFVRRREDAMLMFELLTWLAFGSFLAVFKLYLPREAPPRSVQVRTALIGASGGVIGGAVGRMLAGSAMAIGGFSVFALVFAGAVALVLLALASTPAGNRRARGGPAAT